MRSIYKRVGIVFFVFAASLSISFFLAQYFSVNLHGQSVALPTIGQVERLSLPKKVTHFAHIRSFEIRHAGANGLIANDFSRVFINGYHAANNENQWRWFKGDIEKSKFEHDYALARHSDRGNYSDYVEFLKPGWNHVVLEIENTEGECGLKLEIAVNGETLTGFPRLLTVDKETLLPGNWASVPKGITWKRSVLCKRQTFQFFLE